jgi:hypothetical protein
MTPAAASVSAAARATGGGQGGLDRGMASLRGVEVRLTAGDLLRAPVCGALELGELG